MVAWKSRIMRGEWSRALLYTVSVNGRACSESEVSSVTQKAAPGEESWGRRDPTCYRSEDVRTGEMLWTRIVWYLGLPCWTPQVYRGAQHGQHWEGRELCAPINHGVNTCWVGLAQSSPLTACSGVFSVASSLPMNLSLVLFSFVSFCVCRLVDYKGNLANPKWSNADWPVLLHQIRAGANSTSCVCQSWSPVTSLYLPLLKTDICRFFQQKSGYLISGYLISDKRQNFHSNCLFSLFMGAQEITVQLF